MSPWSRIVMCYMKIRVSAPRWRVTRPLKSASQPLIDRRRVTLRLAADLGCVYFEHGGFCHQEAAGVLEWDPPDTDWPMCSRHLRAEYHPRTLHGRLRRWPAKSEAS